MKICMNSMRIFQNAHPPIKIDAARESEIMEQIYNGLKICTDRMAGNIKKNLQDDQSVYQTTRSKKDLES
jgi:hypothetical protein